ncbi:MAG: 50S ribosomal protein L20 [Vulcanimicrobiota bacterium]
MPRVKRGVMHKKSTNRLMKQAKGYRGTRSRRNKQAREQVLHSMAYQYRDRRNKKRDIRKLWIIRINAAARLNGLSYSGFMSGLKKAGVEINRKMLAELAVNDSQGFAQFAKIAKDQLQTA